ncbi:hypothetical protein L227DRAFT_615887 [Lentinus tigrinus ALCF2SS1-6]|uniref:Major facilitator superfamily (MFS) profile domain-containing protein n=1 Tax=Lentinus tigrinus ALCF2SS1-6 TaxID=1328759 RepID=A0A5C2RW16_9APHY|nr:hypothetical protein L227DRAFT_615887 [Lentinus tigrinus ALCF2SS1-6]
MTRPRSPERLSVSKFSSSSIVLGGLLAFGLVRIETPVLTGWQFLFLIEAIPTIIMAFMILLFLLPSRSGTPS